MSPLEVSDVLPTMHRRRLGRRTFHRGCSDNETPPMTDVNIPGCPTSKEEGILTHSESVPTSQTLMTVWKPIPIIGLTGPLSFPFQLSRFEGSPHLPVVNVACLWRQAQSTRPRL